jgi:hypothetical protein
LGIIIVGPRYLLGINSVHPIHWKIIVVGPPNDWELIVVGLSYPLAINSGRPTQCIGNYVSYVGPPDALGINYPIWAYPIYWELIVVGSPNELGINSGGPT